jgi:NTP pyrophosphatase (non-canonical NTP hydrolase)
MMDLSAIVARQINADERRGFRVRFGSDVDRHDQLVRDLVGLMGEVGEFANELKKVGLGLHNPKYNGPSLEEASPNLREELADAAIYLFRLSTILGGDFEQDVLSKMNLNDDRYRELER